MQGPEKVVCCSLCLCLAVAVLSSVSLVYLTFIVYLPAKKEMESGLLEIPVICTTVERLETDHCNWRGNQQIILLGSLAGEWASCFEWCLSKPNNCVQLWAAVRKNGSELIWSGCREVSDNIYPVQDKELVEDMECENRDEDCEGVNKRFKEKCLYYRDCPPDDEPFVCEQKQCVSRREVRNCKRDGQCVDLEHQYLCHNGLCQNLSRVMECHYTQTGDKFDCTDKRNCITITGLFNCEAGECTQVLWPWDCRRKCPPVEVESSNVIILSGDRTVTAVCDKAVSAVTGNKVWEGDQARPLLVSCTDVVLQDNLTMVQGLDCRDGMYLQGEPDKSWDWTSIRQEIVTTQPEIPGIPLANTLTIFDSAKVISCCLCTV